MKEYHIEGVFRVVNALDLAEIAVRIDNEEKLLLKYSFSASDPRSGKAEVRVDRLLDVAEDRGILYVERDGAPSWVKLEEAIEVLPDTS